MAHPSDGKSCSLTYGISQRSWWALATHGHKDDIFHERTLFSWGVRLAYTALFTFAMEYVSRYLHSHVWHCRYLWFIHGTHHHQYVLPLEASLPTTTATHMYLLLSNSMISLPCSLQLSQLVSCGWEEQGTQQKSLKIALLE